MVRSCGLPISCTSQLHAHRPKKLAGVSAFDLCKENERSWKEEISGPPRLGNPLYMSYMYSTCTVHIWYKLYITYIIIYIYTSRRRYQWPQAFCEPHASCPATAGNGLGETETSPGADGTIHYVPSRPLSTSSKTALTRASKLAWKAAAAALADEVRKGDKMWYTSTYRIV